MHEASLPVRPSRSAESAHPIIKTLEKWSRAIVLGLLGLHAMLLAWGAYRHSPTYDEVAYLPAGVSHWMFGRFDLAAVSPPLVRLVAAAPVVLAKPETDWRNYEASPTTTPAHRVGRDFAAANGDRTFWLFTLARWACIPFSLLGGWICFAWARALYGPTSGLLSCCLWCFSPNILAHGQLMTPDVGTTALGVASAFTFWRWLIRPTGSCAFVAGAVLGLAQLTKSTLVIFFVLWPTFWLIARLIRRGPRAAPVREGVQLGGCLILALYLLNLGYGFQGAGRLLKDYEFVSRTLSGEAKGDSGNRFTAWGLGWVPVPLPENYLRGLDFQKKQLENRSGAQRSFLHGAWRDRGWWYYYLYALAIKVPLGTWLLGAIAAVTWWTVPASRAGRIDELVLFTIPLVLLVLVSAQTGFSHHLRYALPIFPYAFIAIGRVAEPLILRSRWRAMAVGAALAWSAASSLLVYPHSLSYFNELVGGPQGGHAHLIDSNIDWGQDLLYLREWLAEHPEAAPIAIAYFGNLPPEVAGVGDVLPPGGGPTTAGETDFAVPVESDVTPCDFGPKPGWYAVSVNYLRGVSRGIGRDLRYFQSFTPVDRAGYSILIYHITPEDADRERARRGLPLLKDCPADSSGPSPGDLRQ